MRVLEGKCSKFIGLLLALVFILSGVFMLTTTYAEDIDTSVGDCKYITEDLSRMIVEKWTVNYYGESAKVERVDKIYNLDETLYGYNVEFSYDVYYDSAVIVDTFDINKVVNSFTVFTPRNDKQRNRTLRANSDRKLYIIAPYTIAEDTNNGTLQVSETYSIKRSSLGTSNYSDNVITRTPPIDNDTFLDTFTGNVQEQYIFIPHDYKAYRQDEFSDLGNCGHTAVMNVLKYWQSSGYDLIKDKSTTYNAIVGYIGREEGSTLGEMETALKKYVKATNKYKASTFLYWGAFWGYYKSDLGKNRPVIHCIDSRENGKHVGHAMTAFGYTETDSGKFLRVASGWYSNIMYINFDAYSQKSGSYCTIK